LTRITDREYEETYKRVFDASYNIGRCYIEWEESIFGMTPLVKKWKNMWSIDLSIQWKKMKK